MKNSNKLMMLAALAGGLWMLTRKASAATPATATKASLGDSVAYLGQTGFDAASGASSQGAAWVSQPPQVQKAEWWEAGKGMSGKNWLDTVMSAWKVANPTGKLVVTADGRKTKVIQGVLRYGLTAAENKQQGVCGQRPLYWDGDIGHWCGDVGKLPAWTPGGNNQWTD